MNELATRKQNCPWLDKEICHIKEEEKCPDDCDLKDLKFDKDEIIKRMKEEEQNVRKLKKEGMFKNRQVIKDKIMGVYTLGKVLKDHFQHIETRIIDKELEKTPMFLSRGWRQVKKR